MRLSASPFDSEHYELNVGRIQVEPGDHGEDLCRTLERARQDSYDVLFVRVAEADPVRAAIEKRKVGPLETLVTSTHCGGVPVPIRDESILVEEYEKLEAPADIDAVCAIAADVLTGSHLHIDDRLPEQRTRALFAAWTRNDVTGRAQHIFLARRRGEAVGFITVIQNGPTAVIDLVAVRRDSHGSGIGSSLLGRTLKTIAPRAAAVMVGTQAENPALQLYARFGFLPTSRQVTYHLWLDTTR